MKSSLTSVLKDVGLSLLGVSLAACTGEPHKKETSSDAVPVTVGRVQKVQERETISVSGTVLWLGTITGLVLSIMSALNICTSACSKASVFTIFGLNFGWFGVIYFLALMGMLVNQFRFVRVGNLSSLFVFAAAGAELRFIWLQKYVIGRWCPLCLSIAAAIYLMSVVILVDQWNKIRTRRTTMKTYTKSMVILALAVVFGISGAVLGVKEEAKAAELNLFIGNANSPTIVYFVTDWFCPACRRVEPAIEEIYQKIAADAKIGFVDVPVHPETSNFTPYNTEFLVYEKGKYLLLRGALNELAMRTKNPSPDEVQKAVAPYGVKIRSMNYADIASGMDWNRNIFETYGIKGTPTVIVANEKTGKHVNLRGNQISYEAIMKATDEVGK